MSELTSLFSSLIDEFWKCSLETRSPERIRYHCSIFRSPAGRVLAHMRTEASVRNCPGFWVDSTLLRSVDMYIHLLTLSSFICGQNRKGLRFMRGVASHLCGIQLDLVVAIAETGACLDTRTIDVRQTPPLPVVVFSYSTN